MKRCLCAARSGAPQGRGCEMYVSVVKLRGVSEVGFIAVVVRAKLLLDAYCVESPGVLQRNISAKLVLLT